MADQARAAKNTSGGILPLDTKGHDWQRETNADGDYLLTMICGTCGYRWMPYESLATIRRCRG